MASNRPNLSGMERLKMRFPVTTSKILLACLGCLPQAGAEQPRSLTPRELFYAQPAPAAAAAKGGQTGARKRPAALPAAPSAAKEAAKQAVPAEALESVPANRPVRPLGLRYSIVKYASDGSASEVDSESVFRSGDLIRLRIRVNEPGYLYVAHKGSSGSWSMLFPSADLGGGDNTVVPGKEYDLPGRTRLIFDDTPGVEKIFLVLSRRPEAQMDRVIYDLDRAPLSTEPKSGKTLIAKAELPDAAVGKLRMTARDLVFEKVDVSKAAPPEGGGRPESAVYVVNASASRDARLVADITLTHR